MQFNLKTHVNAIAKISPSILKDYVTRDELISYQYVTHPELDEILKNFVREVENGDPSIVYGRQNGKWVPIIKIPEHVPGVLVFGMTNSEVLTAENLFNLTKQSYIDDIDEYLIEYQPSANGYFWFACTTDIVNVEANNGLVYEQSLIKSSDVMLEYDGEPLMFKCYRTKKLVALPNTKYKFRVRVAIGDK